MKKKFSRSQEDRKTAFGQRERYNQFPLDRIRIYANSRTIINPDIRRRRAGGWLLRSVVISKLFTGIVNDNLRLTD